MLPRVLSVPGSSTLLPSSNLPRGRKFFNSSVNHDSLKVWKKENRRKLTIPEEWGTLALLTDSYVLFHCFSPSESESRSVVSDSLWPHGLYSAWNSPGQNIPSPADLPDPGVKPGSLALQVDSFPTELSGKPCFSPRMISKKKSHIPSLRAWGTGLFLMAMSVILDCGLSPCFVLYFAWFFFFFFFFLVG